MPNTTQLEIATKQIEFARQYNLGLLEDIDEADWFRQPNRTVTHIAWQAAHLAIAQYGLALFRIRGRQETDNDLVPSSFRKQYGKGSSPDPEPNNNATPAEIRDVLSRVHAQVLQELPAYSDEQLDTPVDPPHAVFDTKMGALLFCSQHEMMHAGQIGLLRRMLGKEPLR